MPKQMKSIEQLRRELEAREAELSDLQKKRATVEKMLNDIDRQIAALTGKAGGKRRGRKPGKQSQATATTGEKSPYTSHGVRTLRKNLNLSQEKFGKLVGVSPLTVYQWEKKSGTLKLRGATQKKLAKVWNSKSEDVTPIPEANPKKNPAKKTAKKKAAKKKIVQK